MTENYQLDPDTPPSQEPAGGRKSPGISRGARIGVAVGVVVAATVGLSIAATSASAPASAPTRSAIAQGESSTSVPTIRATATPTPSKKPVKATANPSRSTTHTTAPATEDPAKAPTGQDESGQDDSDSTAEAPQRGGADQESRGGDQGAPVAGGSADMPVVDAALPAAPAPGAHAPAAPAPAAPAPAPANPAPAPAPAPVKPAPVPKPVSPWVDESGFNRTSAQSLASINAARMATGIPGFVPITGACSPVGSATGSSLDGGQGSVQHTDIVFGVVGRTTGASYAAAADWPLSHGTLTIYRCS